MDTNFVEIVSTIAAKELSETPLTVTRMTTGGCNEVYSAELSSRSVIVRMNTNPRYLTGSEKHIPMFRSLGITVPEILASDYSHRLVPVCYQIQSRLKGKDLGHVIASLAEQELIEIAKHVVGVFRKTRTIATNGKYGYVYGDDNELRNSWSDVVRDLITAAERRNAKTFVVGLELLETAREILRDCESYFDSVPSICFYDDISSKNVLVDDGRFVGIVDLDGVAYGDPLEAIGRIKACWFGTRHGDIYLSEIQRRLELTESQRKLVTVYATIHRICWLSERGIQWNLNTAPVIDPDAVERDRRMIATLRGMLS